MNYKDYVSVTVAEKSNTDFCLPFIGFNREGKTWKQEANSNKSIYDIVTELETQIILYELY